MCVKPIKYFFLLSACSFVRTQSKVIVFVPLNANFSTIVASSRHGGCQRRDENVAQKSRDHA